MMYLVVFLLMIGCSEPGFRGQAETDLIIETGSLSETDFDSETGSLSETDFDSETGSLSETDFDSETGTQGVINTPSDESETCTLLDNEALLYKRFDFINNDCIIFPAGSFDETLIVRMDERECETFDFDISNSSFLGGGTFEYYPGPNNPAGPVHTFTGLSPGHDLTIEFFGTGVLCQIVWESW